MRRRERQRRKGDRDAAYDGDYERDAAIDFPPPANKIERFTLPTTRSLSSLPVHSSCALAACAVRVLCVCGASCACGACVAINRPQATFVSVLLGFEYECPAGHRFLALPSKAHKQDRHYRMKNVCAFPLETCVCGGACACAVVVCVCGI
jgi:hypothetical protein